MLNSTGSVSYPRVWGQQLSSQLGGLLLHLRWAGSPRSLKQDSQNQPLAVTEAEGSAWWVARGQRDTLQALGHPAQVEQLEMGGNKCGRCAGTPLASEEVVLCVTGGTAEQELAWTRSARVLHKEMEAGASHQGWILPSWGRALTLLFNGYLLRERCFKYFSS